MKSTTKLISFFSAGLLALLAASCVHEPRSQRSSSIGTDGNLHSSPSTSGPPVVLGARPIIRREFVGGVSLIWTSGVGGVFYTTNAAALVPMWHFLSSTSWTTSVAPRIYVNGKLVAEPPDFGIRSTWVERLDAPASGDAAAMDSYVHRMRGRNVDTYDFRHPPPPVNLKDLKP
jgi:hypothetical protein